MITAWYNVCHMTLKTTPASQRAGKMILVVAPSKSPDETALNVSGKA